MRRYHYRRRFRQVDEIGRSWSADCTGPDGQKRTITIHGPNVTEAERRAEAARPGCVIIARAELPIR